MTGAGVLIAAVSVVLGYVIGSLPLSALVGRAAVTSASVPDGANPGAAHEGLADVWDHAGLGWRFLALVADLARGVLPVTLATATFSPAAGLAAGAGAVAGALWPALGRMRAARGRGALPAVASGVLAALVPLLALGAGALVLAVIIGRRAIARAARTGR